ncbi:MAG: gamma-glutamylcyclotransferase [Alphaproteobacteria bacterium]
MPPRAQPDLRHLTDQYELTDAELATTCTAVMATHPPREDLWVFGYGSLMWKPEFPFLERHAAHVHGFHRSFCVYSHVYRGTRARPGLVLALDAGGSCRGVAYRVAADSAAAVVERLVRREMVTRVYLPRWVPARLADGRRVRAHTYTAAHDHEQYAGKLTAEEAARIIRGGIGRSGHNVDYLRSTVAHLAELGIADRALVRIAGLLADTEEPLSAGGASA